MAENKRQHYVPKFYLRRFSHSKKHINLINVGRNLPILGAALKTQAYEDYFYGSDLKFEKMLGDLEASITSLIDKIVKFGYPPPQYSEDHIGILYFAFLQNTRTLYNAEMVDEMTNQTFAEIMSKDPKITPEMLEQVKYGFDNPVQFAMGAASDGFALATDLEMKVVRNYTSVDLITSDNPVVFYNKFFDHRNFVGNTGYQSKGLLIIYPLDPRALLVFYDNTTYRVGDKKKRYISVRLQDDIIMLNRLQLANCNENVYFREESDTSHLIPQAYTAQPYRRRVRTRLSIHKMKDKPNSELLQLKPEDLHIGLSLTFLHIQKKAKKWLKEFEKDQYQPAFVPRDIRIAEKYEQYRQLAKDGRQHPLGFVGYLNEN